MPEEVRERTRRVMLAEATEMRAGRDKRVSTVANVTNLLIILIVTVRHDLLSENCLVF